MSNDKIQALIIQYKTEVDYTKTKLFQIADLIEKQMQDLKIRVVDSEYGAINPSGELKSLGESLDRLCIVLHEKNNALAKLIKMHEGL